MTQAIEKVPACLPAEYVAKLKTELVAAITPYLAAKQSLYDATAALAATMQVSDADSLKLADDFNKEILRERDGLEEVRKAGPGALDGIVRVLNAKFKPLRDTLDGASLGLKSVIGAHVMSERNRQVEAYQAATVAHMEGDHAGAQQALAAAADVETTAPQGTSVREVWEVERYALDLMILSAPDRPGLVPDEQAINAYLRKLPITQHPGLPGVICKKVPTVTARRAP